MPDKSPRYVRETDPTLLRLRLFGQMEARTLTGESVLPIGGKTRALLAILALSDRKPVLRSRLAELLWSQRPEEMARASLRQEIHRLLDALSPLGVDVIDVQRHSLALKPALTSVDAERILTATSRTIEGVVVADAPLLGELVGIDPALDEWLVQQRARVHHRMVQLYESTLQELTDSIQLEDVAERLGRLDPLNEAAWTARIQAALRKGDVFHASALAEELVGAYRSVKGRALSVEARVLIGSVLGEEGESDLLPSFGSSAPVAILSDLARSVVLRPDPMLLPPLQYAPGQNTPNVSRTISLALLTPLSSDGEEQHFGGTLRDLFELVFVQMGVFDVLPAPANDFNDPLIWRNAGIDYVVSGNIRTVGAQGDHRLILRVLDMRRGGIIVWGTYFDFPAAGPQDADVSLLMSAQALQWHIFLAEARRISERADAELSPLGMGMRAFALMLQQDRGQFARISSLLDKGIEAHRESGLLALIKGIHCFTRFHNDWSEGAGAIFDEGLASTRMAMTLLPDLHAVPVLLGAYLMHDRAQYPTALSIVTTAAEEILRRGQANETTPDYIMARIVLDVLTDQIGDANVRVEHILRNDARSQLLELLRPAFVLVLVLSQKWQEVIAFGRRMAGMYPSYPLALVYYLVALVEDGGEQHEIDHVRQHLLRLVPDLTVSRVVGRLVYVDPVREAVIAGALERAGLPVS